MGKPFITCEFPLTIERTLIKQLNFALVLTYTRCAQAAQAAVRAKLPQQFKLRNNFVSRGIKIEAATRQNPESCVFLPTDGSYSLNFMLDQELGGNKFPVGKHLAIPIAFKPSKGRRSREPVRRIIRAENRPRHLLATGDYRSGRGKLNRVFLIDENTPEYKRHGLFPGIYASQRGRKGKHRGKGDSKHNGEGGLTMLYMLIPEADMDQRFHFIDTCEATVKAQGQDIFGDCLTQAVRTAR